MMGEIEDPPSPTHAPQPTPTHPPTNLILMPIAFPSIYRSCYTHIYISFYHCTDIWPQLRTQCAGEEAVPSTCVGGARPCAGRGATRARSAAPRRPRQVRANQVHPCTCGRWGATAPALEARQRCKQVRAGSVRKRTYRCHLWLVAILAQNPPVLCPKGCQPFGTKAQRAALLMHLNCCNFRPTGPFGITLRAGCAIRRLATRHR